MIKHTSALIHVTNDVGRMNRRKSTSEVFIYFLSVSNELFVQLYASVYTVST
jgi:hypothetical protein